MDQAFFWKRFNGWGWGVGVCSVMAEQPGELGQNPVKDHFRPTPEDECDHTKKKGEAKG